MSSTVVLEPRRRLTLRERALGLVAMAGARLLTTQCSGRIRRLLTRIGRRAGVATEGEAAWARQVVCSVSLRCAGRYCVQRSVATVLLCRLAFGRQPTWCIGVHPATQQGPFHAHAWVEVGGDLIGEPAATTSIYTRILTVPPGRPGHARHPSTFGDRCDHHRRRYPRPAHPPGR